MQFNEMKKPGKGAEVVFFFFLRERVPGGGKDAGVWDEVGKPGVPEWLCGV